MKILAIETSCDETAMALVEASGSTSSPRFRIKSEIVSSQVKIHRPFGGVVPMLAKREHLKNLPIVYRQIFGNPKKLKSYPDFPSRENRGSSILINQNRDNLQPNLIAATIGPGLEPALWTGVNFAKELGKDLGVKVAGVNHLEGHIYSNWLPQKNQKSIRRLADKNQNYNSKIKNTQIRFPAICLIVSGGHTILLLMEKIGKWRKLGETRDDAAGEAFDKVARMLGLPYPGGPEVEALAKQAPKPRLQTKAMEAGSRSPKGELDFPRPMMHDKSYDFSFSGLKTAVLYYIRDTNDPNSIRMTLKTKSMIACSFQEAAIDVLVHKTLRAAKEFKVKSILLCGGVACNQALQKEFRSKIKTLYPKPYTLNPKFFVPNIKFNTDNAVMIAAAAYLGKHYPVTKALPNLGV